MTNKNESTKTINPLHFEDLEPHRFEDLSRQLIYDFRNWDKIEATGRSGSDDGYDARAFEIVEESSPGVDDDNGIIDVPNTREWLIQCKREQKIGPKKLGKYVDSVLSEKEEIPHGVIFTAACDFSKKAKDRFREKMKEYGVREFRLWGKGELEDKLFQQKNAHLLFIYFNLSITHSQKSAKANLRHKLSVKRKISNTIGGPSVSSFQPILIRNVNDANYPYKEEVADFDQTKPWMCCVFTEHYHDGIVVVIFERYAYINDDLTKWDYIKDINRNVDDYCGNRYGERERDAKLAHDFWNTIPEKNKATLRVGRLIPYSRIVAIDDEGDSINEVPHVYVEYTSPENDPFIKGQYPEIKKHFDGYQTYYPRDLSQTEYFPKEITEDMIEKRKDESE